MFHQQIGDKQQPRPFTLSLLSGLGGARVRSVMKLEFGPNDVN